MAAGDLSNLAAVRAHLGLDVAFTKDDGLLSSLITSQSGWLRRQLDRDLTLTTYTDEAASGNGGAILLPRQYPIVSVTSLTVDGVAIPARSSVTGTGYVISGPDTMIRLVGYSFTEGVDNVVLTYTAGYGRMYLMEFENDEIYGHHAAETFTGDAGVVDPIGYEYTKGTAGALTPGTYAVSSAGYYTLLRNVGAWSAIISYQTLPHDIMQAVNELVAWRYKERNRPGQVSASVGGETVTFSSFAAPQSVNLVIAAHRRYAI